MHHRQQGNFSFNSKTEGQTLVISSVGYEEFVLKLSKNTVFPLNVVLMTANYSIDEVIIRPEKEKYSNRENPAVRLIEEIISNKMPKIRSTTIMFQEKI